MINRTIAPSIKSPVDFAIHLKSCEKYVLDNGIPLYAVDAGAQDVVMVEWVFYAGNWHEAKNIVAATTNYMLKSGTVQKTAFSLSEYFEFHGAYLNRSCYNETATITLHCLSKHLQHLLPVVAEILTESIFPESELAIYKQNQKQRLQVNLRKCDFVANRLIDEYLFGIKHPYGKYTSTLDYDAIEIEELRNFYQQYYRNGNCMIFAAGKLPAALPKLLNQYFGHLPINKHPVIPIKHEIKAAIEKKYNIVNDEAGIQGAIRLARPFPNRHHVDFQPVQVLNNVLGGFFGSRLMSNIREDKGYTYGIHSYLQNHIHSSAWVISTEAGKDVCGDTIKEIYHEMQLLCDELIPSEELDLIRNYMLGSILGDLDGPFQIIARWKNYILNGVDETTFNKNLGIIRNITVQELRMMAQKYLQPKAFYELLVI